MIYRTRPAPNGGSGNVTTTYTYDALNRLLTTSYSDGSTPTVTFAYDEATAAPGNLNNTIGRKSSEKVTSGSTVLSAGAYSYDPMGRVASNWQCTADGCPTNTYYLVGYGWDYLGDMTSMADTSSGASLNYGFNSGQRLTTLTSMWDDQNHPGTMLSGVHYDAFSSITGDSFGNGAVETFTYYPRGWLQTVSTEGPNPGSNSPSTGSVTINGSERNAQIGNTPATATVTLSGHEGSTIQCPDCCPPTCTLVYDTGTVTITVNGTNYQTTYGQGSTPTSLATALTTVLNNGSLVTATSSSGTISMTTRAKGTGANYSLSTTIQSTNQQYFPPGGCCFTAQPSGSHFTGGTNTTVYDTGTVTITVGSGHETVNYGQSSTATSVASGLVSAFNNDSGSLVTAQVVGTTVDLTSKATGAGTNYSLSASSGTTNGQYFSGSSFTGSPSGSTMTGGANGEGMLYSLSMAYAPNGDVLSANDSVNGNWSSYQYDAMNRLVAANCTSHCPNGGSSQSFTYDFDRYGNRWHQNSSGGSTLYTFTSNTNQIAGSGIQYDALGNVTNDGLGHTFTYDAENRISSVNGGISYAYGANGERVRKVSGATYDYITDLSGRAITELTGGSATRTEVFAGGRHLATYAGGESGTTYFSHPDWLGTERVRSTVTGPACETVTSLAFGDQMTTAGTCEPSPLHFTGKQRDPETGLDDFPARYYSSIQGRWMTPDWSVTPEPVPYAKLGDPQTLNLYAYVGNDPTNHADPDGHFVWAGGEGLSPIGMALEAQAVAAFNDSVAKEKTATNGGTPAQNPDRHKQSKTKPLVKANPPYSKAQSTAAASQEVDYYAVTPKGNQSKDHVVGLNEKFIGPHPDAHICSPSCTTTDPALIHEGEFEDLQVVYAGQPYSVERRWSVDGQPAQVLDPRNNPFDYEILHQSIDTNPPFQIEYKNDPNP